MKENYKVYKHINKINGKIYIGLTGQNINERFKNGKGYKSSILFYNAIKKYGWVNFEHIVLFVNLTQNEAQEIEKELILYHHSNDRKFGYNISSGGNISKFGIKRSEDTKRKISENSWHRKHKGKNSPNYGLKRSEDTKIKISENNGKKKKIICLELNRIFNSMSEASRILNLKVQGISNACLGKYKTCGKLHFQYYNEE